MIRPADDDDADADDADDADDDDADDDDEDDHADDDEDDDADDDDDFILECMPHKDPCLYQDILGPITGRCTGL